MGRALLCSHNIGLDRRTTHLNEATTSIVQVLLPRSILHGGIDATHLILLSTVDFSAYRGNLSDDMAVLHNFPVKVRCGVTLIVCRGYASSDHDLIEHAKLAWRAAEKPHGCAAKLPSSTIVTSSVNSH